MEIKVCNRNCRKCGYMNVRTDRKGYPFGFDCLKYGDSIFPQYMESTKTFVKQEKDEREKSKFKNKQ